MKSITLTVGQAIAWTPAPNGFAQICELRRSRVRICYPCKNGNWRFALPRASDICAQELLFEMTNPFNRGQIVRQKTFIIEGGKDASKKVVRNKARRR